MWSTRYVPPGPSSHQSGALRVFLSWALFLVPSEGCEPSLTSQSEALCSRGSQHSFLLGTLVSPLWASLASRGHTAPQKKL